MAFVGNAKFIAGKCKSAAKIAVEVCRLLDSQ